MTQTSRNVAGITSIAVGLALIAVAAVGLAEHWGTTAARSVSESPNSTLTPSRAPGEAPQAFLDELATGLRTNDTASLVARLNPAVIQRYGQAQCQSYLPSIADPTAQLTVQQVGTPTSYEWATDGKTSTIANTQSIVVTRVARSVSVTQTVHIALVANHYTWFTDCGKPAQ